MEQKRQFAHFSVSKSLFVCRRGGWRLPANTDTTPHRHQNCNKASDSDSDSHMNMSCQPTHPGIHLRTCDVHRTCSGPAASQQTTRPRPCHYLQHWQSMRLGRGVLRTTLPVLLRTGCQSTWAAPEVPGLPADWWPLRLLV
eukprot:366212-Chlamydomonas_euryale.AAC.40